MDPNKAANKAPSFACHSTKWNRSSAYFQGLLSERVVALNPARHFKTMRRRPKAFCGPKSEGPRLRVHANRTLDIAYASSESLKTSTDSRLRYYTDLYSKAKRYANIDEFKQAVASVADSVARIHRNGGQVVFLRLPASVRDWSSKNRPFLAALFRRFGPRHVGSLDRLSGISRATRHSIAPTSHIVSALGPAFTARLVDELRLRALDRARRFGAENLQHASAKKGRRRSAISGGLTLIEPFAVISPAGR